MFCTFGFGTLFSSIMMILPRTDRFFRLHAK
jgi:hypothetical protein